MRESYVIRDSHSTYKTVNYHYKSMPCTEHIGWLRQNGYEKALMVLPHDGATRDRVHNVSFESALNDAGFETQVIPNQGAGAVKMRIEAVRRILPSVWFNDDEQNTYGIHIKSGGKFILTISDGVSLKGEGGRLEVTAPDGIKVVSESDLSLSADGSISLKAGGGISLHSSGLTHNGTNVGATHVHGGVYSGGSMTGGPK